MKICDDLNGQINIRTKQKYEILSATVECIPFPMFKVKYSFRIWTRVTASIFYADNHYSTNASLYTFIYSAMGKLSLFWIISFLCALCFQVLSTVKQTRVSSELSVKKTAVSHNSLFQKLGSGHLYCLVVTSKVQIRFQCVSVCRRFEKS